MIVKCSNGRKLLITDIDSVKKELGSNWVPYVVLLTAWSIDQTTAKILDSLVKFLLVRGARAFVCLGSYSEQLHDEIDEIIYEYDEEHDVEIATGILTTYHADESIEDVVNYFVYGTELPSSENGGLLAIVDTNDRQVRGVLEKV